MADDNKDDMPEQSQADGNGVQPSQADGNGVQPDEVVIHENENGDSPKDAEVAVSMNDDSKDKLSDNEKEPHDHPLPVRLHSMQEAEPATNDNLNISMDDVRNLPTTAWNYVRNDVYQFYVDNPKVFKKEFLSGITVAVLQVPESVAFSFVAKVDPIVGLYGTFFMGLFTGLLGGKPGMISGAAGAMAVVMVDIMDEGGRLKDFSQDEREQVLFMCLVFVGVLQLLLGFVGAGRFVRLIPQTAMIGFMNGLAIIIFMAQLTAFKECKLFETFTECTEGDQEWMGLDNGTTWLVLTHVVITMLIMYFVPKIPKYGKFLPASLVALLFGSFVEHAIFRAAGGGSGTRTVKETASVSGGVPTYNFPDMRWNSDSTEMVFTTAISLALVGGIESVMTLQAVNEITETVPKTYHSNMELCAQGVGNLLSGIFGGLGGDAMIGQSTINAMNGARHRLSGSLAGLTMLFFIIALSTVIEQIPVSVLTGVLFMVVIHTFHWPTFITIYKARKSDAFAIIMVTVLAVLTNLAYAVIAGVIWHSLVSAWDGGDLIKLFIKHEHVPKLQEFAETIKVYHVKGTLFFGSINNFFLQFDIYNDEKIVIVDFRHAVIVDFSAIEAVKNLLKRYISTGRRAYVRNFNEKCLGRLDAVGGLERDEFVDHLRVSQIRRRFSIERKEAEGATDGDGDGDGDKPKDIDGPNQLEMFKLHTNQAEMEEAMHAVEEENSIGGDDRADDISSV